MKVSDLLDQIPADIQLAVQEAVKRHKERIRRALRADLRLKTRWKDPESGRLVGFRCPVRVDLGYPKEVGDRFIEGDFDLLPMLLAVEEDVLGNYEHPISEPISSPHATLVHPQHTFDGDVQTSIHLYWAVIGLFASRLGVTVEALSSVVLAHELAHYYTHLGYDWHGCRWTCQDFTHSDSYLKEGLAQYCTQQCTKRLDGQIPGMQRAYERLLQKQSGPYLSHLPWLMIESPEDIGDTLAQTRRSGPGSYEEFSRWLCGDYAVPGLASD